MTTPATSADPPRSGPSRRTVLTGAAGLTGLAASPALWSGEAAEAAAATSPGTYSLEFDGTGCTPARVSGCELTAETVVQTNSGTLPERHVTNIRYTDLEVVGGTGMASTFYSALTSFTTGARGTHDGVVTRRDATGKVFVGTQFFDAPVTLLRMPALERGTTAPAQLAVTLTPGRAKFFQPGGPRRSAPSRTPWLTGGLRLEIDGIDCTKVVKVGGFAIKQTITPSRDPREGPTFGPMEFSELAVTIADNQPASFIAWIKSFLVDGNHLQADERTGRLLYLDTSGRPLFALNFTGLGILRLSPGTALVGQEKVVRTMATIYCESASFAVNTGVAV